MTTSDQNEIVGHKTFRDRNGFRHDPLTRAEADALWNRVQEAKQERARKFPTEQDAVNAMWDARQRLIELGWQEERLCPPDGKIRKTICIESTGIHDAYREPRPSAPMAPWFWWWHPAHDDLYPHRPILFRELKEGE